MVTKEKLASKEWMQQVFNATAKSEGFRGSVDDKTFNQAWDMYQNKGQFQTDPSKGAAGANPTTPGSNTTGGQAGGGQPADKKKLIFMHGLWDRYKDAQGKPIPPEKIEAQAKSLC